MKVKSDEIEKKKKMLKDSIFRRYENGYVACWIDKHPNGLFYRDIHNSYGVYAFPEEKIMLLQSCGMLVMFIENLYDLGKIEREMKLKRIYEEDYV